MMTWCLETDVFTDGDERLKQAALAAGHQVLIWDDNWTFDGRFPKPKHSFVVFHGSLGNAAELSQHTNWKPGAICNTKGFHCSSWYQEARHFLLHGSWLFTTVQDLVDNPRAAMDAIGGGDAAFVRPDSPLKPFSGRVLTEDKMTLSGLDHGFYYDDAQLPILIAPVVDVGAEWRFVVVSQKVVAGSAYEADGRTESARVNEGPAWDFAAEVAAAITAPDPAYILDICQWEGSFKLLELNPFSGADHYACDRSKIVAAISAL